MSFTRSSILKRSEASPWAEEAPPASDPQAPSSEADFTKAGPSKAPTEQTPLKPRTAKRQTGPYSLLDLVLLFVLIAWLVAALRHDRVGIWNDKQERYIFMIILMIVAGCTLSALRKYIASFDTACTWISDAAGKVRLPTVIESYLLPAVACVLFCVAAYGRGMSNIGFGFIGMAVIPTTVYALSMDRGAVKWDTVLGGFGLQVLLALFGLKFPAGKEFLDMLGKLVTQFLGYALSGELMVFGKRIVDPTGKPEDMPFAFKVLPTIIYFAAFVSICYYLGIMQRCILAVSAALKKLMGASTIEAVSSAGNIFLGISEVPLLLKPLLPFASKSELHAIMVCGYASVAGSAMAGYIGFGINPEYLILSCLISAPTSVAMSRLACPSTETRSAEEDEESAARTEEALKSSDGSAVEAAGNGASEAIGLVANIAAMLIAFMGLMYFLDVLSGWFFAKVGYNMTLSVFMGYLMSPFAFIMGVPPQECVAVGLLLAKKLLINEFVSFMDLGNLVRNRSRAAIVLKGFDITVISKRSEVISTFAMCGFANVASIGITLGALSAICPNRRSEIASLVVRSMLVGFAVSMFNGCLAGILIDVES